MCYKVKTNTDSKYLRNVWRTLKGLRKLRSLKKGVCSNQLPLSYNDYGKVRIEFDQRRNVLCFMNLNLYIRL